MNAEKSFNEILNETQIRKQKSNSDKYEILIIFNTLSNLSGTPMKRRKCKSETGNHII